MRKYLSIALVWLALQVGAQDLKQADADYQAFVTASMANQRSLENYNCLHRACTTYSQVLSQSEKSSPDYLHSREKLLEAFNFLGEAAYYFTRENDEANTLRFAKAFVDVSVMSQLADKHLTSRPGYAQFPYFLANHAHREGQLQDAALYYRAYLQTGDEEFCENAFLGLTLCYYDMHSYDNAIAMATLAVQRFSTNADIIQLGIDACDKGMRDDALQPFLDLAFRITPGDRRLTILQADLYERQRDFDKAIGMYRQMLSQQPDDLTLTCHIGVDYFNRAVQLHEEARMLPIEGDAQLAMNQAREYFRKAAPYLGDVVGNKPWAVNFARSLAHCYNVLGDADALQQANRDLAEQKMPQVKAGDMPVFQVNYDPEMRQFDVVSADTLSYVDIDIPEAAKPGSSQMTYAIIIGNENYRRLPQVRYGINDARVFAEYCRKVMGIPADHIEYRTNATKTEMDQLFESITDLARIRPGELRFIIYYAGHGFPDFNTGTAYLVPTDADASNMAYCCSLDNLYERLDKVDAQGVTVFLDACFSGASRAGGVLKEGRFVCIDTSSMTVEGKTVAFSAASGDQASLPYHKEHHGIFTYALLKHLKDSRGRITYGELADNLLRDVSEIAIRTTGNSERQTPTVRVSDALGETWREMKFLE